MTILPSAIAAFREYLISENKANSTIKEYMRYVNRFAAFAGDCPLDEPLINQYRGRINGFYNTANSKNSCISYTNSFLKFLGRNDLLMPNFTLNRAAVKLKTPALTDEDIEKLLHYADNDSKACEPE